VIEPVSRVIGPGTGVDAARAVTGARPVERRPRDDDDAKRREPKRRRPAPPESAATPEPGERPRLDVRA